MRARHGLHMSMHMHMSMPHAHAHVHATRTLTLFSWPIRCERAIACRSFCKQGGGARRVSRFGSGGALACMRAVSRQRGHAHLRVPVRVEEDARVGGSQVDADAARSGGEQEGEDS